VRLIPRDEQFFDMFAQLSTRITASAKLLNQLFTEPTKADQLGAQIKAVEHEADAIVQQVNVRIDKSFVTPLDREDIHLLATRLDNVIDLIDGTARRAVMFRIRDTESKHPARALSEVLVRAAHCIESAVRDIKNPKSVGEFGKAMKKLEEEGDAIYQDAIGALFAGAPDPIEVIKWKEIYDKVEDAVDECDNVSNVLESIAIKNS
jgi:predicted phosphate transport protein (TIGR00153 family)